MDAQSSEQEDESGTNLEGALPLSPYENQVDDDSKEIDSSVLLKTSVASWDSKPLFIQAGHVLSERRRHVQEPLVPSGDNQANEPKKAESLSSEAKPPAHQIHQSSGRDQRRHQPAEQCVLKRPFSFDKSSTVSSANEQRPTYDHLVNTKDEHALAVRSSATPRQVPAREAVHNPDTFIRSTLPAGELSNFDHVLSQKAKPKEMPPGEDHRRRAATLPKDKLISSRHGCATHTAKGKVVSKVFSEHFSQNNFNTRITMSPQTENIQDSTSVCVCVCVSLCVLVCEYVCGCG